jgi:predicted small lipoprotein YifL
MNRRFYPHLPTLLLALVLPFALAACGNKGPLVLPDKPPADAPAADATAEPAAPPAEATTDAPADAPQPPPNRDR